MALPRSRLRSPPPVPVASLDLLTTTINRWIANADADSLTKIEVSSHGAELLLLGQYETTLESVDVPGIDQIDLRHAITEIYFREYIVYPNGISAVCIDWTPDVGLHDVIKQVFMDLMTGNGDENDKLALLYEYTRYEPLQRFYHATGDSLKLLMALHADEIRSRIVFRNVPFLFRATPRLPADVIGRVARFM